VSGILDPDGLLLNMVEGLKQQLGCGCLEDSGGFGLAFIVWR